MLWSLRAFATVSLEPPSRIPAASASSPAQTNEELTSASLIRLPFTSPMAALASPNSPTQESSVATQRWFCHCGLEQGDFCPYCDYDQAVRRSFVLESVTECHLESRVVAAPQPIATPKPRKLRKSRPDYQQLQYEPLQLGIVTEARPHSILSTHSRTPLLNPTLPAKSDYLPVQVHRTSNKLEKRRRSHSTSNYVRSESTSSPESIRSPPRRIKSKSFIRSKSISAIGPRPKAVSSSINTDALVSLAWTGEVVSPMASSEFTPLGYDASQAPQPPNPPPISRSSSIVFPQVPTLPRVRSETSISGNILQKRRSILRKKDSEPTTSTTQRPWTLAMAITDDSISDERLVDDLEEMRIKEVAPSGPSSLEELPLGFDSPPMYRTQLYDSYAEYPVEPGEAVLEAPMLPSDSSWTAARQVLLLCRELVRTERRYSASLRTLITNGTSATPPALMLSHLPALITASDDLLELMEVNPSVRGVSEAFLANKDNLEAAFVAWSSIVGQFFHEDDGPKGKTDPLQTNSEPSNSGSSRSRAASTKSPSMESPTVVILEPNKIRRNSKPRPTIRELAILPTQRIVRYVLLFKELSALAPAAVPSSAVVEEALRAAQTIAQNANNAQGHSAFKPCVL
ncbi:unnamed protein product [Cyclocybe aegerita]|uniref:DH domain-containing protein n=1 Tax=Cyclocybe aegerita TaxID=1973307 RepID=A0A8S0WFK3_CYCAE|nr:unnamed protein product [Cyclocybe aegerita]